MGPCGHLVRGSIGTDWQYPFDRRPHVKSGENHVKSGENYSSGFREEDT